MPSSLVLATLLLTVVRIDWRGDAPPAAREATLHARRVEGDAPPVTAKVQVPGEVRLALGKGVWELSLDGPRMWSAPAIVGATENAAIPVWPTGRVSGTFKPVEPLPKELQAHFSGKGPSGVGDCAIDGANWQCELPLGVHDVRLEPRPYVPVFRWDVRVAADAPLPFGAIELRRGASVTGTVEVQRGTRVPFDVVHARMSPASGGRRQPLSAPVNKRGFFHFPGVPAGDYVVSAEGPGVLSDVQPIRVLADRTATLGAPLRLGPPRTIQILLDPPRDPDGDPWQVTLAREQPGNPPRSLLVARGAANQDGIWTYARAIDGRYGVEVSRKKGGWQFAELTVDGDDVERRIDVSGDRVAGRVKLGGRPLAARLRFGGEYGAIASELTSDEEGQFRGEVPPGDDTWDVLVEADRPRLKRTVRVTGKRGDDGALRLDIDLPSTLLPGVVVQEDGKPVPNALLTVEGKAFVQLPAGADGTFEIAAVPEGEYTIGAGAPGLLSERVEVTIRQGENPPLRMVVKPARVITGRLVFGDMPVGRATLWVEGPPGAAYSVLTDASGRFEIVLSAGRPHVDFAVHARGFSVVVVRAAAGTRNLRIPLDQQGARVTLELPERDLVMVRHRGADLGLASVLNSIAGRGTIELPPLAPGHYSFCAGTKCVSTTLAPHGATKLSLR